MKLEIKGYIVAIQYPWNDTPIFFFFKEKPLEDFNALGYVVVKPHTIEVEIPDNLSVPVFKFDSKD